MTALTVLAPIALSIGQVSLRQANASRFPDVHRDGKSAATISYSADGLGYDDEGNYEIVTTCDVILRNGEGAEMAQLRSEFSTEFRLDVELTAPFELNMIGRLQLAVSEATHPYHRDLILRLSEQFDIPAYRMPFGFNSRAFTENFFEEVRGREAEAETSNGEVVAAAASEKEVPAPKRRERGRPNARPK